MDQIWADAERERRHATRRLFAEAVPYPTSICIAGGFGALILARTYPGVVETTVILEDLWWALVINGIVALPVIERYRRYRHRILWYQGMAWVCRYLDEPGGLVAAIERAAEATPEPVGSSLAGVAFACSTGIPPARALRDQYCPEQLATRVETGGSEREFAELLRREFRCFAKTIGDRLQTATRVTPAIATALAGVVLLWLVVRVALPILTTVFIGEWYA